MNLWAWAGSQYWRGSVSLIIYVEGATINENHDTLPSCRFRSGHIDLKYRRCMFLTGALVVIRLSLSPRSTVTLASKYHFQPGKFMGKWSRLNVYSIATFLWATVVNSIEIHVVCITVGRSACGTVQPAGWLHTCIY